MNYPGLRSPYSSAIVRGHRGSIALLLLLLWVVTVVPAAANDAGQYNAEKFVAAIEVQGEELRMRSAAAQLHQNCVYCHGEQGRAESSYYPRLAGQGYEYLTIRLTAVRDGDRIGPAGVMSGLATGLSDADIDGLSRYFPAL
jgi:cytochrome c553